MPSRGLSERLNMAMWIDKKITRQICQQMCKFAFLQLLSFENAQIFTFVDQFTYDKKGEKNILHFKNVKRLELNLRFSKPKFAIKICQKI